MQKFNSFDFVVLIPVFHNEDKIKALKNEIDNYILNKSYFICFVDDSSNDSTSIEIKKNFDANFYILKRNKKEKYSTRFSASFDGFKWIVNNLKTRFIVEIDSDLSHHPKDILKGINLLNEESCDLVIGSKYLKDSMVKNRKILRVFISKFITLSCRLIFDKKITDYSNTYRFYTSDLVKKFIEEKILFKSPIGHLHNLLFILKKNYSIKEIPVEYIEKNSESTVKIISMFRYLLEFIHCIILNKFFRK